ncbi:MAG: thiol-disulfide oxidoreductase DCC family protein [Paracoccaceae bacterium]
MSTDLSDTAPETNVARADPRAAHIVYYDGNCPVCRREIGWYGRMRGAEDVRFVDIVDAPVPDGFTREALLRRFTVIRRDGVAASGARGFAALWRALGPTRLLGRVAERPPIVWIAEGAYRLFLRIRKLWR